MATVKQDGIVFEYPDDVDIPESQKANIESDEVEIQEVIKEVKKHKKSY